MTLVHIIIIAALIWAAIFITKNVIRYNKLRKSYYNKFKFYLLNGYVNESYCNIYMEIFSKFRFHMFVKYTFYGYTTIYDLTDNNSLYQNYKISRQKKKQERMDVKQMNEVFVYWRDQTL